MTSAVKKSVEKKFPKLKVTAVHKRVLYQEIILSDGTRHKYDLLGIYQGPVTAADEKAEAEAEAAEAEESAD